MSSTGQALRDAAEELRDDSEIVELALLQDGSSVRFASERLRSSAHFGLLAMQHDGENLQSLDKPRNDQGASEQMTAGGTVCETPFGSKAV